MRDKIPKNTVLTIGPGIYRAAIATGVYDHKENVCQITLRVYDEEHSYSMQTIRFPMKNLWWLLNKLCKAVGYDLHKRPVRIHGKDALVGKELWMATRLYQECNRDGEVIIEYVEPFEFYKKVNDSKPSVLGAPHMNNGKYFGHFNKQIMYKGKTDVLHEMPKPKQLFDE